MSVRMPKPLIAVCMTLPLFGLGTHGLAAPAKGHHPAHTAPASLLPATIALPGSIKKYSGTPIDVLTYHYDNFRTGWNQAETDLTPATVASSKFGLLQTLKVDGNVFAQPLLVTNVTVADGTTHDILIVATGHDTVYAYDAQSYAILWQVSLGTPQSSNDVGCGDVVPEYGITSTPVVIRTGAAATLYVVAATEATHLQFASQLHALNVATGADILPAVTIAPSATLSDGSKVAFDPQNQWNRTSLAINNGNLYVGIGSHCDNSSASITGWLLRYNTSLALQTAFHTIETPAHGNTELASIWMTGFAPAIDPSGHVYVVTGNGDYSRPDHDFGESALNLPANLTSVTSRFTPASYRGLNDNDTDFGSGGIMLLPPVAGQTTPASAVSIGKDATLYLLNAQKLGGEKHDDSGALQATRIACSGCGTWGGPAYYASPSSGPLVYLQTDSAALQSFSVATTGAPGLKAFAQGTTSAGYGGSLPIVSSNAQTAGTGLVWLIRRSVPMALEAYNADSLGAPVFTANAGKWSNTQDQNSFVTPMVANGRVYAPAYKTVSVFGLAQ
jgi:hypothetical protein